MYIDRNGKSHRVNYCGGKMQKEMADRGWTLKLINRGETAQQTYDRLAESYSQVKVYYDTTMIRGYHENFAFVKK